MIPEHAIKVPVKNVKQQKNYTCGVAALRAVFLYYGVSVTERQLETIAKTTYDKGTDIADLVRTAKHYDFKTNAKHNMNLQQLKGWLDKKRPVIVCMQMKGDEKQQQKMHLGHYTVVIGYDEKYLYFQDPMLEKGYRGKITHKDFLRRWKDSTPDGKLRRRWGLAVWKDGKTPTYPSNVPKVRSV